MKNNSQSASKRYSKFFKQSALDTCELFKGNFNKNIKIKKINKLILEEWRSSWGYNEENKFSWNWDKLFIHYSVKGPKYIPISLWANDDLIGMCILKISKGRQSISILYIEKGGRTKFYKDDYVKSSLVIIIFTAIMGKKLQCKYISVIDPINTKVEHIFIERYGFHKDFSLFGNKKSLYLKIG